jgi:NTP pyrophosphatase (non-canonical NTP hydrolase)
MLDQSKLHLLILTMEECGELIRACSKVYRKNADEKSVLQLVEETGDVLAMIELLVESELINWQNVKDRAAARKQKMTTQ